MPYCHECGTEIADGSSFCPECGTSLSDSRSQNDGTSGTETREASPTTDAAETDTGARDQSSGTAGSLAGRFWVTTLVGAVLAFVLGLLLSSFTGGLLYFVGVIGGAFVGGVLYRQGPSGGAKVGAVSGGLSTIPFAVLLFGVLAVGLGGLIANTPLATNSPQGENLLAAYGVIAVVIVLAAFVANIVFGVIGGLVGGAVASD
ncbi:zinc ribbon domain-containing protein [Haloglomus salinum]|uniref:zinc ribbon domain-containing protein n=1 Tax=Haloglomus salinum TaxID=2962673 RepID=UPI0020CA12B4|nr:zinc-ribbon domain-containing protein [Haloglomus salinum]